MNDDYPEFFDTQDPYGGLYASGPSQPVYSLSASPNLVTNLVPFNVPSFTTSPNPPSAARAPGPDPAAALQQQQAAYLNALTALYQTPPPQNRQPTLGTRDLAWAIPALLGALSGHNGQQLAAGLVSGGLQANQAANNADNQRQLANWQFGQQQRANAAQVAGQALGFTQPTLSSKLAALAQGAGGAGAQAGIGANLLQVGPGPQVPLYDFYDRYTPDQVNAARAQVDSIAQSAASIDPNGTTVDPARLWRVVSRYPRELQAELAGDLVKPVPIGNGKTAPLINVDPSSFNLSQLKQLKAAYTHPLNFFENRLNDPNQSYPLSPDEQQIYKRLKKQMSWIGDRIDELTPDDGSDD